MTKDIEYLNTPIILIHGIRGSHLAQTYDDSFDVIWSGIQNRYESILDLELDPTGQYDNDPFGLINVQRIEKMAYGEILSRLRKQFKNTPVYIYRYDWRLDIDFLAQQFVDFVEKIKTKTQTEQINVITHSMGGLILARYLKLDTEEHLKSIRKAAITAPPFGGSYEAVKCLIIGEDSLFSFNSSEVFRKIARSFPSVYQLLPSLQPHWEHPEENSNFWDIAYWQQRVEFGSRNKAIYVTKQTIMQNHLSRAKQFAFNEMIDLADYPDHQDKFLLMYGKGAKTLSNIIVKDYNSDLSIRYLFDFEKSEKKYTGDGDGVVPINSALRYHFKHVIPVNLSYFKQWWNPFTLDDRLKTNIVGFHPMFLGLDKVQSVICDWIQGKKPDKTWIYRITP
jgi:pimeloyl-ACP methyl ester carboxylesterase